MRQRGIVVTRIASTVGGTRNRRWRWPSSSDYQGRRLGEARWNGTPPARDTTDTTDTFNTNNRSTNRSTTTDVVTIGDNRGYGASSVAVASAGCPASTANVAVVADVTATSTSTSRPSVARPGRLCLRPVVEPVDVGTTSARWPLAGRLRLRPTWYALVWDLQPRHRRGEGGSLNGCTTTATMPATAARPACFLRVTLEICSSSSARDGWWSRYSYLDRFFRGLRSVYQ